MAVRTHPLASLPNSLECNEQSSHYRSVVYVVFLIANLSKVFSLKNCSVPKTVSKTCNQSRQMCGAGLFSTDIL